MPTIFVHIQQRKKRLALHIKSHLYVTYIVISLGTKTSKRDHMHTITSRMQQSKTNLARCVAVTTAAYMFLSHARHKGITAPGTLMTTALQMQLDELPTAILSVGGVCGKPRQIAQRLTASRDRKHASAREKEERQTQLNKWANHRDKAGHASFRMLRQQVTRHSGGFLANFSLMKMLEEPALWLTAKEAVDLVASMAPALQTTGLCIFFSRVVDAWGTNRVL